MTLGGPGRGSYPGNLTSWSQIPERGFAIRAGPIDFAGYGRAGAGKTESAKAGVFSAVPGSEPDKDLAMTYLLGIVAVIVALIASMQVMARYA
jgi:hypothetical protein